VREDVPDRERDRGLIDRRGSRFDAPDSDFEGTSLRRRQHVGCPVDDVVEEIVKSHERQRRLGLGRPGLQNVASGGAGGVHTGPPQDRLADPCLTFDGGGDGPARGALEEVDERRVLCLATDHVHDHRRA
jgi:hypothetical protein